MKNRKMLISTVLRAVALAMGVAGIVLGTIDKTTEMLILPSIGVFALAMSTFFKGNRQAVEL
jgi:hypothetical protein